MARKLNDNRTSTPVMIEKSVKLNLSKLRNKDPDRAGNESDNKVISRVVEKYMIEHPNEVHEPRNTYSNKPAV